MKTQSTLSIAVSGGHHTPAFAFLEELARRQGALEVLWFGHKHSLQNDESLSLEYLEVNNRGYRFVDLIAGKLYRSLQPLAYLKTLIGLFQALYLLGQNRPALVVSFGGYLSVPMVLAAWFLKIPVVIHEQTAMAGFANRLLAKIPRLILVSFEESLVFFPPHKTFLVGNPIRGAIFNVDQGISEEIVQGFDPQKKTLYITGGKQGAHAINEVVKGCLPKLLEHFNVIHQSGAAEEFGDYEKLKSLLMSLPFADQQRYKLQQFFAENEIGAVFQAADIAVSRSGANSITELGLLGKVALLIPLPHTPMDEQEKNAQILSKAGSAVILPQSQLDSNSLINALLNLTGDWDARHQKAQKFAQTLPRNSAALMVEKIEEFVPTLH